MATFRDQALNAYSVGSTPPTVTWTVVKGDTAAFRVYVTDDNKKPLTIADWDIEMEIKRPTVPGDIDSNTASHVITLFPEAEVEDGPGEFTVSLTSPESRSLNTGDIFDIELRDATRVWTVARGKMIIIEDITNNEDS